jgi:hypothetical protein
MQYVTNNKGKNTAVIVPIREWNELQRVKNKIEVLNDLENALYEVSEIKKGKLPKVTLREFLNEL